MSKKKSIIIVGIVAVILAVVLIVVLHPSGTGKDAENKKNLFFHDMPPEKLFLSRWIAF